ncbi:hypothetical protein ASC89_21220 [Devosia sp. Root413D1]|nr:hypothetical protein ASC89_21220 [Devosia sp. Root413D1]
MEPANARDQLTDPLRLLALNLLRGLQLLRLARFSEPDTAIRPVLAQVKAPPRTRSPAQSPVLISEAGLFLPAHSCRIPLLVLELVEAVAFGKDADSSGQGAIRPWVLGSRGRKVRNVAPKNMEL